MPDIRRSSSRFPLLFVAGPELINVAGCHIVVCHGNDVTVHKKNIRPIQMNRIRHRSRLLFA